MAREDKKNTKTSRDGKPRSKKEQPSNRLKTKQGEYIHHDLYDHNGWVTSCVGEDATPLFEAVDKYYFEHRKKIAMGKLKRGTPFMCSIIKRVGLHETSEVPYIPGSTLGNRYRWRDEEDEEEEFDFFAEY